MENLVVSSAILFGLLVLFLLVGIPIGFSLGLASLIGIGIYVGTGAFPNLAIMAYQTGTGIGFISLPLFILMAEILAGAGA